jgi:membrane carboxypeptidase/penicillin-binding protein
MPTYNVNFTIRTTEVINIRARTQQEAEDNVANMNRRKVQRRHGYRSEILQVHNITVNSADEHDPNSPGKSTVDTADDRD